MVAAIYGRDTYGDILPARVAGGIQITDAVCYRATRENAFLAEIPVVNGEVAVDLNAAVAMTFTGEVLGTELLTPFRDWIAPVITIERPSTDGTGNVLEVQQLGLYQVQPAEKRFTAASSRFAIDGRDPTWLLASDVIARPYNIAAGVNYSVAIRQVIESAGISRHAIQTTAATLPRKRSWKPGTTKLQIANDLARSNGFLSLFADRTGRIRSRRFQRLGTTAAARTISTANGDVIRELTLTPDQERLTNHVVVVGNNPDGDPVIAERLNDDPSSPTSTVSLGSPDDPVVITKYVEDSNIDDQDAADQLADRLMDEGTSAFVRMEVVTFAIANWTPNDIIACDIVNETGDQIANGKWRWTGLRLGFGSSGRTTWTLEKLMPWAQVS
jgi:hypothetical protein